MKSLKILMVLMIALLLVNFNFIFAADPIANYSFDVDASDATGNFNGTLEGDAAIVDDAVRGKVLFLESTGYVSVPPEVTATMENFSFTAWMDFSGSNEWAGLMGMGVAGGGSAPYWDFHVRSGGELSFYGSEIATWPGDGTAQTVDFNLLDLDPGWVHIALTFTLGSVPLCYVNGEVQTTTDWNSSNDHDVSPQLIVPDEVMIGKDCFNQNTLTSTKIDEFQFFDTALTEEEVIAIYNGATNVEEEVGLASSYQLAQNYPNPFNPETSIKFDIPESSHVKLSVFNIDGQEMAVLVDDFRNAGTYSALFNGSNLTSGVYFYRLEANGHNTTKRMILMK
ncbi:LamG-like jellyroll fold domain-containing protein [bacterium]